MQIGSLNGGGYAAQWAASGKELPQISCHVTDNCAEHANGELRDLARSINLRDMNRYDAMALANALMEMGEVEVSSTLLPLPPLKVLPDGSVKDMSGTPEGEAIMQQRFDLFAVMEERIAFRQENGYSTGYLEEALVYLEKLEQAAQTPPIDEYV